MELRRRIVLAVLTALFASAGAHADFVRVANGRFEVGGKRYAFVGANLWYGMSLGSPGPGGDRARLRRELDRLKALGVTNLRVLGLSQGPNEEPWRIAPALENGPGVANPDQLEGLEFLLHEMGLRGMRAVVCLNNFWPWSGGMAQYVRWAGGDPIPYPPPEPGGRRSRALVNAFTGARERSGARQRSRGSASAR